MDPNNLTLQIEAIIFTSDKPVAVKDIVSTLSKLSDDFVETSAVEEALITIATRYESDEFSFSLNAIGGGYQFLSKQQFHPLIAAFLNQKSRRRLSTAALETLAIVAYKQPVTKGDLELIRGVNCDYTIGKLLEKELVVMAGRAKKPGAPILYSTSENFMEYFGISSVNELPKLKDIQSTEGSEIGETKDDASPSTEQAERKQLSEQREEEITLDEAEESAGTNDETGGPVPESNGDPNHVAPRDN